jgi:phage recombination protein Bet
MNALTKVEHGALALPESELIQTLRDSLYPGAKDNSIRMVIAWCRATGKDPMKRPVHLVPMRVKKVGGGRDDYEWRDIVMPGIVDYRTDAARTGQHAGNDEAQFGPDVTEKLDGVEITYPAWCEFSVYRIVDGQPRKFSSGKVRWLESYATAKNDSRAPNAMWRKRPYGQLEKCAEAMALRRAFPEVGSQPTAEEMEGKTFEASEVIDGATGEIIGQPPAPPQTWPNDAFQARLPRWQEAINAGKTVEDILAFARSKGALTPEQEAKLRDLKPQQKAPAVPEQAAPAPAPTAEAPPAGDDFVGDMERAESATGAEQ